MFHVEHLVFRGGCPEGSSPLAYLPRATADHTTGALVPKSEHSVVPARMVVRAGRSRAHESRVGCSARDLESAVLSGSAVPLRLRGVRDPWSASIDCPTPAGGRRARLRSPQPPLCV